MPLKLNARQEAFCHEYMKDRNATRAYVAVGYARRGANGNASRLIANDSIRSRIAALSDDHCQKIEMDVQAVLQRYSLIATADVNELMSVLRTACRHCHGHGHSYHWRTIGEFSKAVANWEVLPEATRQLTEMPVMTGGTGFSTQLEPHENCPWCDGIGVPRLILHDTRYLSPGARALFAGVKETAHGIEIRMHNQMRALYQMAKMLGCFEKNNEPSRSGDALAGIIFDQIRLNGSRAILNRGLRM